MNERRLYLLRREYRALRDRYEAVYDDYDCGQELAEHISPRLAKWGRRMREIGDAMKRGALY